LVVPRNNLPGKPRFALIEEDEVLEDVQKSVVRQHTVQQDLSFVTVRDDQEGVVMEGVSNDIFVHVVTQISVEAGPDVLVDGFEFDEDKWQTVDEADEVRPAVIVRRADTRKLQLSDGEEPIHARLDLP
jgi:hypothetical protein